MKEPITSADLPNLAVASLPGPDHRLLAAADHRAPRILLLVIGQIGLMFVRGAGRDSIPGG